MNVCPECNQPFQPTRDWQRFCCKDHQQVWHRRQIAENRRAAQIEVARSERREVPPAIMETLLAPRRAAEQAVAEARRRGSLVTDDQKERYVAQIEALTATMRGQQEPVICEAAVGPKVRRA